MSQAALAQQYSDVSVVYSNEEKKQIDTLSLVLTIVGLVLPPIAPIALICPIIGLVCSIIGLVVANRRKETNNVTAAMVIGIIGIVIAGLMLLYLLFIVVVLRVSNIGYL
jgi:FtsH-binding integral membrane protein